MNREMAIHLAKTNVEIRKENNSIPVMNFYTTSNGHWMCTKQSVYQVQQFYKNKIKTFISAEQLLERFDK